MKRESWRKREKRGRRREQIVFSLFSRPQQPTTKKHQLQKTQFENPATGVTHRYWFENPNVGMPVREDGGGGGAGGAGGRGGDSRLMPRECREMVRRHFLLFLSFFFTGRAPPSKTSFVFSLSWSQLNKTKQNKNKTKKQKNREPHTRPPSRSTSAGPRHRPARRSLPPPRPRPRPSLSRSTASPAGWAPCR